MGKHVKKSKIRRILIGDHRFERGSAYKNVPVEESEIYYFTEDDMAELAKMEERRHNSFSGYRPEVDRIDLVFRLIDKKLAKLEAAESQ
jgi:hypothetical protein